MKKILVLLVFVSIFPSCHHDDDSEEVVQDPERTVLVYVAGENNLSSFANDDLEEMKTASKSLSDLQQLIVYVDKAENTPPFYARIKDGQFVDSVSVDESLTSDPATLENALKYIRANYPAKSYGLVLWGHASGWLISNDSIAYHRSRAYGGDTGNNTTNSTGRTWMNIPSMARAIANGMAGKPLSFIFGDCCSFGCVEIAYELRNVAEYIIGSPAEIPDEGAPYKIIIKDLFSTGTEFSKAIIKDYYDFYLETYNNDTRDRYYNLHRGDLKGYSVPLMAVKTSELEALATSTAKLLGSISDKLANDGTIDLTNRVFYAYSGHRYSYDMYNVLKANTQETDFKTWATTFQKAVPYYFFSAHWFTGSTAIGSEMSTFEGQGADCGVLSMFFPRTTSSNWNKSIQQFQWNNIIRWQQYGW